MTAIVKGNANHSKAIEPRERTQRKQDKAGYGY